MGPKSVTDSPLFHWLRAYLKPFTIGALKKATIYYAFSSIICQFLRFLGIIITTRALSPVQFGLFAQATLMMTFTGLFRDIGQAGALIARQDVDKRYVFFNFQMNLVLGSISALLASLSGLFPNFLSNELRQYTWLFGLIIFFESVSSTNVLMLQKQFRFGFLAIIETASLFSWLLTISLLFKHTSGFLVLLWAQLVEGVCRCFLSFLFTKFCFIGFAWGSDLWEYYLCQFAKPTIPWILIQNLLSRIDYLLLSSSSSVVQLGYYERLGQFSKIPMSLSVNLCDKVLMNAYSHVQTNALLLKKIFTRSMLLLGLGVITITICATVILQFFLNLLIGSTWAHEILRLWYISIPLILVTPILANITLFFSGIGAPYKLLYNAGAHLLGDSLLGLLLVPAYGAAGMLTAKSISSVIMTFYQLSVAFNIIKQRSNAISSADR
jgi:polysaccharide transporter, PST family